MNKDYDRCHGEDPCSTILPNGVDLCVDRDSCTVRADVTVDRVRNVLIWGCVTDCTGAPVNGALVKLLKYTGCKGDLHEIAHTYTDCQGRYQFDLKNGCEGRYRVLVNQSAAPCPCEPPCPPACEEPCAPPTCRCFDSMSRGCKSVSRNNVQYY